MWKALLAACLAAISTATAAQSVSRIGGRQVQSWESGRENRLIIQGQARVSFGGEVRIDAVSVEEDAELTIRDRASVRMVELRDRAVLHVRGGKVDHIAFWQHTRIRLYGELLEYDPYSREVTMEWPGGERARITIGLADPDGKNFGGILRTMPEQLSLHEPINPSFDCRKARARVEYLICREEKLARLDAELDRAFGLALAGSADPARLRREQRQWLAVRDACDTVACVSGAYQARIGALEGDTMTNRKAEAICQEVLAAVNDGSVAARILPPRVATETEQAEAAKREQELNLQLSEVVQLSHRGKTRRFGHMMGGGTCGSCEVVDLDGKVAQLYPPDDKQERLRWAGWGACDYVLVVQGEPIVLTGVFGRGESRASLVAWLAPDGAKRALCHLDPGPEIRTKTVRADDPALCRAVESGRADALPWGELVTVTPPENRVGVIDAANIARVDLDQDGRADLIGRFVHESGAGCGYTHVWIEPLRPPANAPQEAARRREGPQELGIGRPLAEDNVTPVEPGPVVYTPAQTPLTRLLVDNVRGRIPGSPDANGPYSVKVLRHAGRPYVLSQGEQTSAAVLSFWGGKPRTWCAFDLLPQHDISVRYPVETWPKP